MHWLNLPQPDSNREPAFQDLAGARTWLAAQPKTQPLLMQALLIDQLNALDASSLPPGTVVELINALHTTIITTQASLEVRFMRKALPMLAEEERIFAASQKLWTRLGIAYLRQAPHFGPKEKCPLLFRAANALRLAEYAHFQASRACPPELDQLLYSVLVQAASSNTLRQPHLDHDFRNFGEANIAGLLTWAILLRMINPYHLTGAQLIVANRALSRWRELCDYQADSEHSSQEQEILLAGHFGISLPEELPQYLNIQPVIRKIHSRLASLRAGESPESLKLGRELSGTACIRLLDEIEQRLKQVPENSANEHGDILLSFGAEHAYAVFRDELLTPEAHMDVQSASLANQRMAVFGFDQVAHLQTAVKKLDIPGETWKLSGGVAIRQPGAGTRRQAPCLIAAKQAGQPRLGVMQSLLGDAAGGLSGSLAWYDCKVQACRLQQTGLRDAKQARIAVFLLTSGNQMSLLLPTNAPIRPGIGMALEGDYVHHLVPTEVVERGIDFVRYACHQG